MNLLFSRRTVLIALPAMALIASATVQAQTPVAAKADFRMRTDIYLDETKPPVHSTQLIFTNSQYIEVDEDNGRYKVIDPMKGRITLLDSNRKSMIHLEMQNVEHRLGQALAQLDPKTNQMFACDGELQNEGGGYFSIGNNIKRYKFKPSQVDRDIAISYGDFANWSVRIKALYPPAEPPQIRLRMNELLMEESQIPEETRLILKNKEGRSQEVVARLILTQGLAANDRSHVARIYQWMQEYKLISDDAFFK
jgi:hypothetical protein